MVRILLVLVLSIAFEAFVLDGRAVTAQSTPSATPSATATPSIPVPTSTPPSPAAGSPTLPPAGTPWPAPTNLRVTTVARLLDDAGRLLPPEQQEHTDVLVWDHTVGSEGQYNVEVTLVPYGGGPPTVLQPLIIFPADRGNGTIGRVSHYPEWLNYQRCYRIRITVPSGTGGIEVGAFGQSACTLKPPVSGPGVTPLPPDAGNGAASYEPAGLPLATAAALLALAVVLAGFASRRTGNSAG